MKKLLFSLFCVTLIGISAWAQDEEEKEGGFKKENLFTGENSKAPRVLL